MVLAALEPDVAVIVRVWSSRLVRGGPWGILEFGRPCRILGDWGGRRWGGTAVDDDADEVVELTMLLTGLCSLDSGLWTLDSGVSRRLTDGRTGGERQAVRS